MLEPVVPGSFIIIACDGLWDVVGDQRACEHVRELVRRDPLDPSAAAKSLVALAMREYTSDNVSVMIISFAKASANDDDEKMQDAAPVVEGQHQQ